MSNFPFTVPLSDKEIRTPTSTQRCPLGTRGATADGRIYRYARAGATDLVRGYLCQTEAVATQWGNATFAPWVTGMLADLGTTYIPAGTTYMYLTATGDSNLTIAANYFKEGWVWVSGTGVAGGQLMKIKSHPAASSGSSGVSPTNTTGGRFVLLFDDGYAFSENASTGDEVSLIKNEYDDVIVCATACTGTVIGVPNCDVTATYYFWLQTWGPCPIKIEAEVPISGKTMYNSTQVAGAVQGITCSTDLTGTDRIAGRLIGELMGTSGLAAIQASTYGLVHLTLAP